VEHIVLNQTVFVSPDGRHLAYQIARGDKHVAVVDGVAGKEYEAIDELYLSPDSRRTAYHAVRGGKQVMVVDGIEGNEYDEIGHER